MSTTIPRDEGPRPFARFVQLVGDGDCHMQLSEELHRLGRALQAQAEARGSTVKGSLTLKLEFATEPTGIVAIAYDITVKEPKPRRPRTAMWLTKHGNFSETSPRQQSLPLHQLDGGRGAILDIDAPAPAREVP